MLASRFPALRIPTFYVDVAKHFGTGVILATGFIHMLPGAFEILSEPGMFDGFPLPLAGILAMVAALMMQLIEFLAISHALEVRNRKQLKQNEMKEKTACEAWRSASREYTLEGNNTNCNEGQEGSCYAHHSENHAVAGHSHNHHQHCHNEALDTISEVTASSAPKNSPSNAHDGGHGHGCGHDLILEEDHATINTYLLEVIIIGCLFCQKNSTEV